MKTKTSTAALPIPRPPVTNTTPATVLTTYLEWLNKQPLADNTRRTCRVHIVSTVLRCRSTLRIMGIPYENRLHMTMLSATTKPTCKRKCQNSGHNASNTHFPAALQA